jgi:hypothetical protein
MQSLERAAGWAALVIGLAWYGYLSGAAGLVMAVAYVPVYLFTVLLWAPWLGVLLLRPALQRPAGPA